MINVYEEKLRKEELLRAAAPEMYEALKAIMPNCCECDLCAKGRAAIARAEGKA